jgi:hypothetical protein
MEHYFEWVGTFEFGAFAKTRNHPHQFMRSCAEEEMPSLTGPSTRYMLRLRDTLGTEEVDMKWRRMNGPDRPFCDRGVIFVFGDDQASLGTGLTLTRVSP